MQLFRNIGEILTLTGAAEKQGRKTKWQDLDLQTDAAFVVESGKIAWIGREKSIPKKFKIKKEINLKKKNVFPGLVEAHTHLVFAGNRSHEFEKRWGGESYTAIHQKGGGILSTAAALKKVSDKDLLKNSQAKVQEFVHQGVTTLEIKSGYGQQWKDELRLLKVIHQLSGPQIVPTFLGAHFIPAGFTSESYLQLLAEQILPVIKKSKLSKRVDIFIEKGFFEKTESLKYLQKAAQMGFQLVIHGEQLSQSGGTDIALQLSALSVDHGVHISDAQIKRLAKSNVTTVMLPTADLYLGIAYPPARKLIDAGARVALATDFNPGSSPTNDVCLVGLLARSEMKMTLSEVWAAYTVGAAYALDLQSEIGSLQVGKRADFFVSEKSWEDFFLVPGQFEKKLVFSGGKEIKQSVTKGIET